MQNLLLKLATLVGVVGVVCLVLLQVNQGIETVESDFDLPEVALDDFESADFPEDEFSTEPDLFSQSEPLPDNSDELPAAINSEFEEIDPSLNVLSPKRVGDPISAVDAGSQVTEVEFQPGSAGPDFRIPQENSTTAKNQSTDPFLIGVANVSGKSTSVVKDESLDSFNPFLSDEKSDGQEQSKEFNSEKSESVGVSAFGSSPSGVPIPDLASQAFEKTSSDDLPSNFQYDEKPSGPTFGVSPIGSGDITLVENENSELTESGTKNLLEAQTETSVGEEELTPSKNLSESLFNSEESPSQVTVEDPEPTFGSFADENSAVDLNKQTSDFAANEQISGPRLLTVPQLQESPQEKSAANSGSIEDISEPARLSPKLNAAPLSPDDLKGEGVVDSNSHKGVQRPNLQIEKVAPKNSLLGQPMVYTIHVRNVGESAAHQVVVEDQIPKGSQLTGTIPRAEMVDKRLIWRLGQINAGEEKKIAVRVIPTAAGQIGSIATVNFVAEVSARTLITAPELKLTLKSPKQVRLGDQVEVQFHVQNIGTADASKVFLRSLLPKMLNHPGGNDLEYEIGTLKAGESKNVHLRLSAIKSGLGISKTTVTAKGDLSVGATAEIEVLGNQLSLSRNGPKKQVIGRESAFINTIQNESTRAIQNIVIQETLPVGVEFSHASAGGQYHPENRTVVWEVDLLNGNESLDLTVKFVPKSAGVLKSSVQAFEKNGVPVEVSSKMHVIGISALLIEIEVLSGPVLVGEKVSLRVKIRNKGSIQADNVDIKMLVPDQMELVAVRGLVKDSDEQNVFHFVPIEALPPGKEMSFDLIFSAKEKGDCRVKFQIQTDQMQQPLNREEAVVILSDTNN